jgi:hypothetical protein
MSLTEQPLGSAVSHQPMQLWVQAIIPQVLVYISSNKGIIIEFEINVPVFLSIIHLEGHSARAGRILAHRLHMLVLTYLLYCILASCYIRLTLNICSFVRQCNTFTS